MKKSQAVASLSLLALAGLLGCGEVDDGPLQARRASALLEGCALTPAQTAVLADARAAEVLDEVVLHCLVLRDDGSIAPTDAAARSALKTLSADLRARGYQVGLALTAQSDDGVDYPPARLLTILENGITRSRATTELMALAPTGGSIELALPPLPDNGGATLTTWASELSTALRPAVRLGLFAPPTTETPSELPGGAAVNLRTLAPFFDRVRVMTLDYSCCDGTPGQTTEPLWLVEAAQLAASSANSAALALDVALPLYGVDFGPGGNQAVSYFAAVGAAQSNARQILRRPSGALHFEWTAPGGAEHQTWFDDARSLVGYQRLFDPMLPSQVGILYYGLGDEDPALWEELARRR